MRVKSDVKLEDVQVQMESCGALLCTEKERCQGGQCTRAARLLEREGATAVWLHMWWTSGPVNPSDVFEHRLLILRSFMRHPFETFLTTQDENKVR